MCIIGANKHAIVATHTLKPHPDISLDRFEHMSQMNVSVGIREGGGNEYLAWVQLSILEVNNHI